LALVVEAEGLDLLYLEVTEVMVDSQQAEVVVADLQKQELNQDQAELEQMVLL
jgi:hypothetical protein